MDWRERGALTREDVAEILSISPGMVDKLRGEGALKWRLAGRRVLIPTWSVRQYLGEDVEHAPAPAAAPRPRRELSPREQKLVREALRRAV